LGGINEAKERSRRKGGFVCLSVCVVDSKVVLEGPGVFVGVSFAVDAILLGG
jgi:hypothetical protein